MIGDRIDREARAMTDGEQTLALISGTLVMMWALRRGRLIPMLAMGFAGPPAGLGAPQALARGTGGMEPQPAPLAWALRALGSRWSRNRLLAPDPVADASHRIDDRRHGHMLQHVAVAIAAR